ncbi:acyl-CoA dehydrogenase family protein [Methylocystis parvus]|uniref:Acyl-CoA dehydrogenase n=1 Tax=Methylocystis parvus TaxID=134 RepID=A0A6B8M546_9HYPH|nr:acyl-CoA dehydrogenase family protein [Methylocystis parvus]QGM97496.1 acyl-CoA dehydrogenase [Methylocystis parvus]WBJ98582.1 acyl-CoA/acyl-ACP dehydrogenase [Methylocystis parvus OBBP]
MSLADAAAPLAPAPPKKDVLARVRGVVARELRPLAARIDAEGLYPSHVLKQLGAVGAFAQHHEGFGESAAIDLGRAIQAMSAVAEVCLSTAFCAWCQDAFGWYLQNSENAGLRARLQADAASGAILGGTGLSNPMKALSGIEPMKLKGERVTGGYRVDGVLPWVSNLETGHYFAFCFDAGSEAIIAIARLGFDGVESRKGAKFIALDGTATRAVGFKNAFVPDSMLLSEALPRFARSIKPGFLLLQTGMAAGLVRNCAQLMRELPTRMREVNAYLPIGPGALEEKLGELEGEILTLAAAPFENDADYLRRVLSARLEGSRLALEATQALMLHAGASAYLRNSVYSRRLRESYFVAIVTPATKHLLKDLSTGSDA